MRSPMKFRRLASHQSQPCEPRWQAATLRTLIGAPLLLAAAARFQIPGGPAAPRPGGTRGGHETGPRSPDGLPRVPPSHLLIPPETFLSPIAAPQSARSATWQAPAGGKVSGCPERQILGLPGLAAGDRGCANAGAGRSICGLRSRCGPAGSRPGPRRGLGPPAARGLGQGSKRKRKPRRSGSQGALGTAARFPAPGRHPETSRRAARRAGSIVCGGGCFVGSAVLWVAPSPRLGIGIARSCCGASGEEQQPWRHSPGKA